MASGTRPWPPWRRILADVRFAPLFAPSSRAEVAIMGSLEVRGKKRSISGKIDRLAVTPDKVSIVDYKTNRPAPATLADVPPAYVLQLALYRALLKPLYPGREVSAALLFTEAPRLIELPPAAMDDGACPTHGGVTQELLEEGRDNHHIWCN